MNEQESFETKQIMYYLCAISVYAHIYTLRARRHTAMTDKMMSVLEAPRLYNHDHRDLGPQGRNRVPSRLDPLRTFTPDGKAINHSDYVRGQSNFYAEITNGTHVHHMPQNVADWQQGDTGRKQMTFFQHIKNGESMVSQRELSYRMFGLSIFNQQMCYNPQWRLKYGQQLDGPQMFQANFGYAGIQQKEQVTLNNTNAWNDENNFFIGGTVHNVPNIWLAQSKDDDREGSRPLGHVSEMQGLWLILRRYEYDGDKATHEDAWQEPARKMRSKRPLSGAVVTPPSKRIAIGHAPVPKDSDPLVKALMDKDTMGMDKLFGNSPANNKVTEGGMPRGLPVADEVSDFRRTPDAPQKQYYWRFDPYVSATRSPPPIDKCMGSPRDTNNQFIGMPLFVGIVTHVSRGPNDFTQAMAIHGQAALYPKARNAEYVQSLEKLDKVEINMRACHTRA